MRLFSDLVVRTRVNRGAKLLDERGPTDWRLRVDLDELDMWSDCVLAQVYRSEPGYGNGYDRGLQALGLGVHGSVTLGVHGSVTHGFLPSTPSARRLTAEWKRQLRGET